MINFDLPKDQSSIIKVIGVGGGGSNAVNHMYNQGIKGVDFVVCNTDQQALDISPVPNKVGLGASLTDGRGAGSIPEVGRNAAIENIDEIQDILLKGTKMVFVTAGMGGGTGTGAAPVIATAAKELGILTVGIVTVPFQFEGRKRRLQAEEGIARMREAVDTLLIINNDRLREMFGNLSLESAFAQADEVLTTAARGIAEVITVTGKINVDFEDVRTVMRESGVAIMGSAKAEGEERAIKAVESALASPLLNDNEIIGAKYVLLNITYGDQEVLMDEISDITDYIQDAAGDTADVIWGHGFDESLGNNLSVTIIATGFNTRPDSGLEEAKSNEKRYISLDAEVPTMITKPIESPTQSGNTTPEAHNHQIPAQQWTETPQTQPVQPEEPVAAKDEFEPYIKPEAVEPPQVSAEEKAQQVSFEFDMTRKQGNEPVAEATPAPEPKKDEVKRYWLDDDLDAGNATESQQPTAQVQPAEPAAPEATTVTGSPVSAEDQQLRAQERLARIKELSMRLKTPSGISDLENEPAYKRRNVQLSSTPHSSESQVSRFTLSEEEGEGGEKTTEIRPNNSFLHDNVD